MSTLVAHPTAEHAVARRMVGFVRLLRDNGFPVGLPEVEDAQRLAAAIDLARPHALRWALRAPRSNSLARTTHSICRLRSAVTCAT